jgi:HAD superfamily hydrolase (TIGR01450 family)
MTSNSRKTDQTFSADLPKAVVLDMDGTFFLGEHLLPGALELLEFLNEKGIPFNFLTNNTSKGKADYMRKLMGLGVKPADARIFTAGDATISYLKQNYPNKRVFLMGTGSLRESMAEAGIALDPVDPEVLVLAYDTELYYQRLVEFCLCLRKGLPYIATHPDLNCPSPRGPLPDIGAMMAMIEVSTGRLPDVILGKPNAGIILELAQGWGLDPTDILMVGDRLYTDIALGKNAGVRTALVLSGETRREDLAGSEFVPDMVFEDLLDLGSKIFSE